MEPRSEDMDKEARFLRELEQEPVEIMSGEIEGVEAEKPRRIFLPALIAVVLVIAVGVTCFLRLGSIGEKDVLPPTPEILPSVWIVGGDAEQVYVFRDGDSVGYPYAKSYLTRYTSPDDRVFAGIADVELTEGEVTAVSVHTDTIRGRLLSISDSTICLEGYPTMAVAEGFRVYDRRGDLREAGKSELCVGYTMADFFVEDNVVQAAVITETPDYETIRVAIGNTEYTSLIHRSITLACDGDMTLRYGEEKKTIPAGETLTIEENSGYLSTGRLYLESEDENAKIRVESIQRGGSAPDYAGILEIDTYEGDGMLLINELPLEEYLYAVVPSEMPTSYGEEALKVQAICARAYAYSKLKDGSYAKYGAHLDDSTMTQVYRSVASSPDSDAAVDATKGLVPTYDHEVISAFFFSTSCGTTCTNSDVWDGEALPYLTDKIETAAAEPADLTDETAFRNFMDHPEEYELIEAEYPMFRWTVTYTPEDLDTAVHETIEKRYEADPTRFRLKSWVDAGYYAQDAGEESADASEEASEGANQGTNQGSQETKGEIELPEFSADLLGKIESVEVTGRGKSGIVKELTIHGEKDTMVVSGQTNMRALLTPIHVTMTNGQGGTSEGWSSLLSPFYYIDKDEEGNTVLHGGGFGHGVGMSQNGTKTLAEQGMTAEEIIKHYYTGVELEEIRNLSTDK